MTDQTEMLIEAVRQHPYLFDVSHEYYKNIHKKAETWNAIAEELNMTGDAVKTKWKNLRDSYLRFKKCATGVTGQTRNYSRWLWSSHLSFLDDPLQCRLLANNFTQEATENKNEGSLASLSPIYKNNYASFPSSPEELPPPPPNKKRKFHMEDPENDPSDSDVDKVIHFLETRKSRERVLDGVDHLFQSYAETFKTFRPKTQAMFKLKLANLFSETELRELQQQEA